jgi:hypothetical protein
VAARATKPQAVLLWRLVRAAAPLKGTLAAMDLLAQTTLLLVVVEVVAVPVVLGQITQD